MIVPGICIKTTLIAPPVLFDPLGIVHIIYGSSLHLDLQYPRKAFWPKNDCPNMTFSATSSVPWSHDKSSKHYLLL